MLLSWLLVVVLFACILSTLALTFTSRVDSPAVEFALFMGELELAAERAEAVKCGQSTILSDGTVVLATIRTSHVVVREPNSKEKVTHEIPNRRRVRRGRSLRLASPRTPGVLSARRVGCGRASGRAGSLTNQVGRTLGMVEGEGLHTATPLTPDGVIVSPC